MISIVPIALRHIEGFRTCLDSVARERAYLGQSEAPPIERVKAFVRGNIANNFPQFVALDGNEVIGWCEAIPHWTSALKHRASLGIGVLTRYRGQGIGKALLLTCIAKAQELGVKRIDLEVRADNIDAIRLYKRAGFVVEGRRRIGLHHDGIYYDTLDMGLLLTNEVCQSENQE
jgi:ribosomal protein S18 acetylase RimI-like enzyme